MSLRSLRRTTRVGRETPDEFLPPTNAVKQMYQSSRRHQNGNTLRERSMANIDVQLNVQQEPEYSNNCGFDDEEAQEEESNVLSAFSVNEKPMTALRINEELPDASYEQEPTYWHRPFVLKTEMESEPEVDYGNDFEIEEPEFDILAPFSDLYEASNRRQPTDRKNTTPARVTESQNRQPEQSSSSARSTTLVCDDCGRLFDQRSKLSRHKRHHRGKRHHCEICRKAFNDKFDLKRHMRTHTGVRPFICEHCGHGFTQRGPLELHLKKRHKVELPYKPFERREKLYICENCGHAARLPAEHRAHLKRVHPAVYAQLSDIDKRALNISQSAQQPDARRAEIELVPPLTN